MYGIASDVRFIQCADCGSILGATEIIETYSQLEKLKEDIMKLNNKNSSF